MYISLTSANLRRLPKAFRAVRLHVSSVGTTFIVDADPLMAALQNRAYKMHFLSGRDVFVTREEARAYISSVNPEATDRHMPYPGSRKKSAPPTNPKARHSWEVRKEREARRAMLEERDVMAN